MQQIFRHVTPPAASVFFSRNDVNDVRLGETIKNANYEDSEIVIVGCPQDEGVRRNGGRAGAKDAPDTIRKQFYKLSDFGIAAKIFDLGNVIIEASLEEIHERQIEVVKQLLNDGKTIISLGGGNDISYPDCRALSEIAGAENLLALNIDAHFDVRADLERNSGTPYRQLLEENRLLPKNFYEIGWQPQVNSPVYFEYLKKLKVNLVALENYQIWRNEKAQIIEETSKHIFWGFDVDAVRASAAPGVSAPNPLGLTAAEFCDLVACAARNRNTKIIEFTEVNPAFDIDDQTAKLVAVAIHKFCAQKSLKEKVG